MKRIGIKNNNIFLGSTEFSLIAILVILFVFFSVSTNSFFSVYNLTNILKQASIIGIIAVASTLVIISGGIDLSVGAVTGIGSLVVALMMQRLGSPIWLTIVAAIIAGAICGLYNGIIIHEFKIAPFIATLGSQIIIRGIIDLACQSKTITGVYPKFSAFSDDRFAGIPKMAIVWLVIVVIIVLILKYTRFGRNIFTIGNSEEVARLSGINLRANKYATYIISGMLCAIAGVLLTSRINSAIPTGGAGYEMDAIAAAVIGGASLSGGRGSIIGTLLGTLLITIINNGGIQLGIKPFIMEVVTGVLITIAVIIDMLRVRKQ
jgi:ribose/xylose/arabinose/galactoside ABC-type transport system permease subunit